MLKEYIVKENKEEIQNLESKCDECKETNLNINLTEFNGLNLCWFCLDNATSFKRNKK